MLNVYLAQLENLTFEEAEAFVRPERTLVEYGERDGIRYYGKVDGIAESDSGGEQYIQLLVSAYPMDLVNFMFPVSASVVIAR